MDKGIRTITYGLHDGTRTINMPRTREQSDAIHQLITKYWAFSGWSAKRISVEFSNDPELKSKYGEISVSGVQEHIVKCRREFESLLDEDSLEKFTGEFVRKQHIFDQEVEDIDNVMKKLDQEDPKQIEIWLKCERAKHEIHMDSIRMMQDIQLVLNVKKIVGSQRKKTMKLLKVHQSLPEEETPIGHIERD